jgi:hypothetical protein
MHQRARYGAWTKYLKQDKHEAGVGYWGSIEGEAEGEKKECSQADALNETAGWIHELHEWQAVRAFNGDAAVGEREGLVGESAAVSVLIISRRTTRRPHRARIGIHARRAALDAAAIW